MADREELRELLKTAAQHRWARRFGEARALLEQALDLARQVFGHESRELIHPLANLGIITRLDGTLGPKRFDDSLVHLRTAVRLAERYYPPEHVRIGTLATYIADTLIEMGELDDAIGELTRAVRCMETGDAEPWTHAVALSQLASLLVAEQNRPAEALPFAQRALELHKVIEDERRDNPLGVVAASLTFARCLSAVDRVSEAVPILEAAVARYRQRRPERPVPKELIDELERARRGGSEKGDDGGDKT